MPESAALWFAGEPRLWQRRIEEAPEHANDQPRGDKDVHMIRCAAIMPLDPLIGPVPRLFLSNEMPRPLRHPSSPARNDTIAAGGAMPMNFRWSRATRSTSTRNRRLAPARLGVWTWPSARPTATTCSRLLAPARQTLGHLGRSHRHARESEEVAPSWGRDEPRHRRWPGGGRHHHRQRHRLLQWRASTRAPGPQRDFHDTPSALAWLAAEAEKTARKRKKSGVLIQAMTMSMPAALRARCISTEIFRSVITR